MSTLILAIGFVEYLLFNAALKSRIESNFKRGVLSLVLGYGFAYLIAWSFTAVTITNFSVNTLVLTPTVMPLPSFTAKPLPTKTNTPEPAIINTRQPTSSSRFYFNERINDSAVVMPRAEEYYRDDDLRSYAAEHARNLAIPSPYSWAWYNLPKGTTATDFVNFYESKMTSNGFKTVYSLDDPNGLYLLKYQSGNEMYAMLFWPQTTDYSANVLIFQWRKK